MILMLSGLNKTSVKRELKTPSVESGLLKSKSPIPYVILTPSDKGTFFVSNDRTIANKATHKQAME